ncbi:unnamed protein product [Lasius platythorax]|uniref:Uncharacterized protein n=1 Tax=Lasius platythorax TaxID=488582 RepID=A0AAV2NJ23_9HYME
MGAKKSRRKHRATRTRTENAIEVTDAIVPSEMGDRVENAMAERRGCVFCVAHAQHELHVVRTRMNDEGTTETAATVRHEREQGDEKRESERTKCRPP